MGKHKNFSQKPRASGLRDNEGRSLDPFGAEVDPDLDYDKFLVLRSKASDKPLSKADVFDVYEDFVKKCGEPVQMWPRNDGALVVEARTKDQGLKIKALDRLADLNLDSDPHPTFNSCKGVVRSFELIDYDTDRLVKKLRKEKVTSAYRVPRTVNGVKLPSQTIIFTFNKLELPKRIRVGYLNIPVEPYVEYPRRCFNCQRFGHVTKTCRQARVCVGCGSDYHGTPCTQPACCANCGGDHTASSRQCTFYLYEKEVVAVRNKHRISIKEARQRVKSLYVSPGFSFAEALKTTRKRPRTDRRNPVPPSTPQRRQGDTPARERPAVSGASQTGATALQPNAVATPPGSKSPSLQKRSPKKTRRQGKRQAPESPVTPPPSKQMSSIDATTWASGAIPKRYQDLRDLPPSPTASTSPCGKSISRERKQAERPPSPTGTAVEAPMETSNRGMTESDPRKDTEVALPELSPRTEKARAKSTQSPPLQEETVEIPQSPRTVVSVPPRGDTPARPIKTSTLSFRDLSQASKPAGLEKGSKERRGSTGPKVTPLKSSDQKAKGDVRAPPPPPRRSRSPGTKVPMPPPQTGAKQKKPVLPP